MTALLEPALLASHADLLLLLAQLAALPESGVARTVAAAAPDITEVVRLGGFSLATAEVFADLLTAAAHADPVAWQGDYHRLFGPNAQCPIHEAGWIRRDRGPIMGDIAGFSRAFGLRLNPSCFERFDHLAAELELLAMILVSRSRAQMEGNVEAAEVVGKAADDFVADHLGVWAPGFCAVLSISERHPVYSAYAAAFARVWDEMCGLQGWKVQPVIAPRCAVEQDEPEVPGCGATGDVSREEA